MGVKNTIGLEAMILSLVRLECAGKTGESFKTFIVLYVIEFSNNLREKMGGKKNYFFGEGTVFQYRPLVLKCTERLGGSFKAFIMLYHRVQQPCAKK